MPLTTLYAIEHTAETLGKLISNSKRCIRFRFAAKSLSDSSSSSSLENHEFDISLIWSINSGKILIICNGEEVRFSEAATRYPKLDVEWKTEDGTELRLVAYASALALMGEGAERQYDLFVGGRSYFTFPREQDIIKIEGSRSDAPPQAQGARMVKSAAALYATGHSTSFCGKVVANSKRIVRFGFATREQAYDITLIWSINSGKALIMCNGQEVRYSSSITTTFPKLDAYWKDENGMELRLVANVSAPRCNGAEGQYDLFVEGQSYFTFPHLDMSSNNIKFGDEDVKQNGVHAKDNAVHENNLVQTVKLNEKVACKDEVATQCSVNGNSKPYALKTEAVKDMKLGNKAQNANLQAQQDQPAPQKQPVLSQTPRPKYRLTFAVVGTVVAIPLVISLAIISYMLFHSTLRALWLGLNILGILAMGLFPLATVLTFSPQLQLLGYEPLSREIKSSGRKSILANRKSITRADNVHIPFIEEVHRLLNISDYVYMFSDFRRMSLMGKVPVPFKFLSLECDEMKQWDVIKGVAHKFPAFDEHGNGKAGIQLTAIVIAVLRFLIVEADGRRMKKLLKVHKDGGLMRPLLISLRESLTLSRSLNSVTFRRNSTMMAATRRVSRRLSLTRRASTERARPSEVAHNSRELNNNSRMEDTFRGLDELEDFFLRHVVDTSCACENHELRGTLCSQSGLHGVQCFLDAIVKESKDGNRDAEKLIELLSRPIDVEHDTKFSTEIAEANELIFRLASQGTLFNKRSFELFQAMHFNDTRIVWTNDRSSDAECLYMITVSHKKSRVTVTFRGTVTPSDILTDINFSILEKPNPIKSNYPGKTDSIELHGGFSEYLFDSRYDTKRTKFDEIADRVYEFGKELGEGGFSLYVTGHSLGGSLAQLFGFHASLDDRFAQEDSPVRVFTFAAAIPGLVSFAKAFQYQERAGRIQHLRIHNDNDFVPLTHNQHIGSSSVFAQTGISMCLSEDAFNPSYVKYIDHDWWSTWEAYIQTNMFLNFNWSRMFSAMSFHSTQGYMHRAEMVAEKMVEDGIDSITLNDLYAHYVGTQCTHQK